MTLSLLLYIFAGIFRNPDWAVGEMLNLAYWFHPWGYSMKLSCCFGRNGLLSLLALSALSLFSTSAFAAGPPQPPKCSANNVPQSWTVNGKTCSGTKSYNNQLNGASVAYSDPSGSYPDNFGSANFTLSCTTDGTAGNLTVQSGASCDSLPPPAPDCSKPNVAKINGALTNNVNEGSAQSASANIANGGSYPLPANGGKYIWSYVSGPALAAGDAPPANSATSWSFTVPQVLAHYGQQLSLKLTVSNTNCPLNAADSKVIAYNITSTNNLAPVAFATASPNPAEGGDSVMLNALSLPPLSTSYDPDGDPIKFSWTQIANGAPTVTLPQPNTAGPSFIAPGVLTDTTFRFGLAVTEDYSPSLLPQGATPVSANTWVDVVVHAPAPVNHAPVAGVSCPSSVDEGQPFTLTSTSTDADGIGTLTYDWTQEVAAPFVTWPDDRTSSQVFFAAAPILGYQEISPVKFVLTVSDGEASDSANCTVQINDKTGPVISVPIDITVQATSSAGEVVEYSPASASDAVDGLVPLTCVPLSGSTFHVGPATTVNCTAHDSAAPANSSSATFHVSVIDTVGPVIEDHDPVTEEATSPDGAIVSYDSPATSDAFDGPGVASCSPASDIQFALGETTVVCTATDSNDQAATQTSFTVNVVDTTHPIVTAPANKTFEATGVLTPLTTADYGSATSSDAVGVVFESNDAPASFPLGKTTITWYARDAAGNSTEAKTVISVVDTTPPVIDAHADLADVEAIGPSGAPVNYTSPATSDLVDGDGIADCTPASGSTFPLGSSAITCTASDAAGNPALSTSFNVEVVDTTPPVIDPQADLADVEAIGPSGAPVNYTSPATSDLVDGDGIADCTPASGSTFPLGSSAITCTASDAAGNPALSTSFNVEVVDTTPPVISGTPASFSKEGNTLGGAFVSYTLPTASDIVAGTVTVNCTPASGSKFDLGPTTVDCSATDGTNPASSSFIVTVIDTTPPVLTHTNDITVEATSGSGAYVGYTKPTASDIVDGALTVTCLPSSGSLFAIQPSAVGVTNVTCTAKDKSNNLGTSSFKVTVEDKTAPAIAAHADVNVNATSAAGAVVSYTLPTASDIVDGAVTVTCLAASGGTFALGTTVVNCSSTDAHGNTGHSSFNVNVTYVWSGFLQPVDNLPIVNAVKAGSAIPVKFTLGGNMGLAIFAAGYPKSGAYACGSAAEDAIEETVTAGNSALSYDAGTGKYIYVWKTDKAWIGTCRQLQIKFADGTTRLANFSFK